jgi:protein phosphatase
VKEAIANGGSDNITVIVVDITGTNAKAERRERRRGRAWIILMLIALVGIIGGSIFAAYNWMQNSAYLAEQDGKVVIYRGIPDNFPGIETHWLVEETDLKVKDLQPGMQTRISDNYPVESVDEAERLVEQYKLQAEEDAAAEQARTGSSSSSSKSNTSKTKAKEDK